MTGRVMRVLVAYSAAANVVPTTLEYLTALKDLPGCEVQFVHCTDDARLNFDINEFDVLINSYSARLCFDWYLNPDYVRAVLSFRGLKIAIAQDEYDRTGVLRSAIRRLGFHVLLTSVQKEFWPLVYPAMQLPGVALRQVLTGYAPAAHPDRRIKPLADRPFPIGYRGRQIGARYGRLGFEKFEIGRYMAALCDELGQPHNIRTDEASRIYGEDWFNFIGDCRTMLGSESGSNAFDFDQELEREIERFRALHGRAPEYPELTDFLAPFERPFDTGQVSPRVFECAAMMTPMILFRGRYSDAIVPDVHYIPLEKDFSNARDVLARLDNFESLQGYVERAHEHLIASGNYSYRALTSVIASAIEELYPGVVGDPERQHWRSVAQPWRSPHDPQDPYTVALSEVPTDAPQLSAYLSAKQDHLRQLLEPRSAPQNDDVPQAVDDIPQAEGDAHQAAEPADPDMNPVGPIGKMWRAVPGRVRSRVSPLLAWLAR
ncbi:hypothetical protein NLM16_06925 [Bradyrhizobium brasilense]|uniref:hypothetical protein n=1 Tax=Bradyrhizobium brasilense TaxID=1419277 RepID=UPI0028774FB1|nr:hypothetical protein [Bradyrhizobium brasilense]MCP3413825.1 hypothetical protein [Bradyrhizobium brasilense]